jgi:hypothetical protein
MKKIIVSMLAIMLAATTMLAGCGTDDNGSNNDVGDVIDSTVDKAGSAIDKGLDDISKGAEDLMSKNG